MTLVVIHYHLRPGGIRRIIELALPPIAANAVPRLSQIILLVGEAAEPTWHQRLQATLPGIALQIVVEPTLRYLSEQRLAPRAISLRLQRCLDAALTPLRDHPALVWAHNLAVGRNLLLSRECAAACERHHIPLLSHHHDWWFDNRWGRWTGMKKAGFRTLKAVAAAILPTHTRVSHAAINSRDARLLQRFFGAAARWIPNLTEPQPAPDPASLRAARSWIQARSRSPSAPVWLLPCRALRRKNIAEALLLTRWLRPGAALWVTGAASSTEEQRYCQRLETEARERGWDLQLGVLARGGPETPSVHALINTAEVLLLTSVQEGFGLPYLEAAAAARPLIARRLPNIATDLHRFGFRFPYAYDELLIPTRLFDAPGERKRQLRLFAAWKNSMPGSVRTSLKTPRFATEAGAVHPFSRLTLTAQLEILSISPAISFDACLPHNPFLKRWRAAAGRSALVNMRWPRGAAQWLGADAYARRVLEAIAPSRGTPHPRIEPATVQEAFLATTLAPGNLHPLLWAEDT